MPSAHDGYQELTKTAYRSVKKARDYEARHTSKLTWAGFTTGRECRAVARLLGLCDLGQRDLILDIPCGTGILADVLAPFPYRVVAADISREMMDLAVRYKQDRNFAGFVQADIECPPHGDGTFGCVIVMGLMHRLPSTIRKRVLRAVSRLSRKYLIVSYSIDSPDQRLKRRLLGFVSPSHRFAPHPVNKRELYGDFEELALKVRETIHVAPLLSAEVMFLLEKETGA
ncbi:MAG TPA: class I SAM-dependent methyltransferase [Syntrophales bacterium]|nr:class I SAM-dependent methyltransferase [Syntrophales bacterium]HOM08285.1 class I SAM-dependent methyltransferase [Syntrophales bacterium]HOO00868.1 class I SAM-dependent methyltransferase [Syntrophales bacterium]HRR39873.1 class I SAM-dependent methyltransferase [Syntrophales bacterium]HRT71166.1 class I SAM-dependent methyltransferase [Syntrophales bacterium]